MMYVVVVFDDDVVVVIVVTSSQILNFSRMGQAPTYSAHNVGFRCAASLLHADKRRKEQLEQMKVPKRVPRHHARIVRDEL